MNVDAYIYKGSFPDLLSFHDNMKFSNYDRVDDASPESCCEKYLNGGGWWCKDCYRLGKLNGVYGQRQLGGIGYYNAGYFWINDVTIKVKSINEVC